ncbi:MAG: hypothetical protein IJB49_03635, partial [Clostridia bacterium]|nr:hypothetical protein [Clostridia bacterium]
SFFIGRFAVFLFFQKILKNLQKYKTERREISPYRRKRKKRLKKRRSFNEKKQALHQFAARKNPDLAAEVV